MPRCVGDRRPVAGDRRGPRAPRRAAARLSLIRSRIPASSTSHRARSVRVGEDRPDDVGAVRGRVRVVGADRDLHVALDRGRVRRRAGDDEQRADALRVEREGLGERGRDEELGAGPDQPAQPVGVLARARRRSPGRRSRRAAAAGAPRPGRRSAATGPGRGRRRSGCGTSRGAGRCRRATPCAERARAARPRRSGGRSRRCTGRCGSGSPPRGTAAGGSARWARSSRASDAGAGLAQQVGRDAQPAGAARRLGRQRPAAGHDLVVGARRRGPGRLAVAGLAVDRPVELRSRRLSRRPALGLDHRRRGPASSRSRRRTRPTRG